MTYANTTPSSFLYPDLFDQIRTSSLLPVANYILYADLCIFQFLRILTNRHIRSENNVVNMLEVTMKADITIGERKLLSSIRSMPGMYIGTKKLTYLEHFIHGYNAAMLFLGISDMHNIIPEGFQDYITEKYNISVYTPKNFFYIILENPPDDEQAFDIFFQLLDEYLESIGCEEIHKWDSEKDSIDQLFSLLSLSDVPEETKPEE